MHDNRLRNRRASAVEERRAQMVHQSAALAIKYIGGLRAFNQSVASRAVGGFGTQALDAGHLRKQHTTTISD